MPEILERARAAIRLGDAATARRVLEPVDPADAAAREALAGSATFHPANIGQIFAAAQSRGK